jgi:predicted adenylyl cyclase CyaB
MPRNVEIKARCANLVQVEQQVILLADSGPQLIQQEDVFFIVPQGRLKLRKFDQAHGELIYYERANTLEPKESYYLRTATPEPDALTETLQAALGLRGIVRKQRTLYMIGQTRVHLDQVEGLGSFLELEVVLLPGQSTEQGTQTALELLEVLGIQPQDLIDRAYIDLLEEAAGRA